MRQNLDRLWKEVYPDGGRASVDPAKIKLRVNTALDKPERRFYMRKPIFAAIACAALVLALAGTALAVYYRGTALSWFEGDTALVEPSVQEMDEVMEKDGWRVRVDSALSDEYNTILGITIEALTDETREKLDSESFRPLGTIISIQPEEIPASGVGLVCKPDFEQNAVGVRSFSILLEGVGVPNTLRIRFKGDLEDGMILELTDQVESLTVTAGQAPEEAEYFVRSCTLSPLGVVLEVKFSQPPVGYQAVDFCFRMADGSLKTLAQFSGTTNGMSMSRIDDSSDPDVYLYMESVNRPMDPEEVSGVLMNGREYSFRDAEKVVPAEIPERLRTFRTPFVERDEAFYFSAGDVCRHLGAAMERDGAAYVIRYLDRELTVMPGSGSVLLNGEPVKIGVPALEEEGELLLSGDFFSLLNLSGSFFYLTSGPVHAPDGWLVEP